MTMPTSVQLLGEVPWVPWWYSTESCRSQLVSELPSNIHGTHLYASTDVSESRTGPGRDVVLRNDHVGGQQTHFES